MVKAIKSNELKVGTAGEKLALVDTATGKPIFWLSEVSNVLTSKAGELSTLNVDFIVERIE